MLGGHATRARRRPGSPLGRLPARAAARRAPSAPTPTLARAHAAWAGAHSARAVRQRTKRPARRMRAAHRRDRRAAAAPAPGGAGSRFRSRSPPLPYLLKRCKKGSPATICFILTGRRISRGRARPRSPLKVAPPAAQVGALAFLAGEGDPEDAAPEPRAEEREADHCSPVELGDGGLSAVGEGEGDGAGERISPFAPASGAGDVPRSLIASMREEGEEK